MTRLWTPWRCTSSSLRWSRVCAGEARGRVGLPASARWPSSITLAPCSIPTSTASWSTVFSRPMAQAVRLSRSPRPQSRNYCRDSDPGAPPPAERSRPPWSTRVRGHRDDGQLGSRWGASRSMRASSRDRAAASAGCWAPPLELIERLAALIPPPGRQAAERQEAAIRLSGPRVALLGRYAELYIATPMRRSQLCAVDRRRTVPSQAWRGVSRVG
jgi:hypothetical protein